MTGSGTVDFLPLWTSTSAIGNSVVFQSGTGSAVKVGINTNTPAATLDVKGTANVQGTLNGSSTQLLQFNPQALPFILLNALKDIANITGTFEKNLIAWLGSAENGIGKMFAEVTSSHRTHQRIAQSVQQHIAVTMRNNAVFTGDLHATDYNSIAGLKPVNVVTNANTMRHACDPKNRMRYMK